jgi:hypothetical protein
LAPGLLLAPLLGLLLAPNLGFLKVSTLEDVSSFGVDVHYFLIPGEDLDNIICAQYLLNTFFVNCKERSKKIKLHSEEKKILYSPTHSH